LIETHQRQLPEPATASPWNDVSHRTQGEPIVKGLTDCELATVLGDAARINRDARAAALQMAA
jgi:hypothetical protein